MTRHVTWRRLTVSAVLVIALVLLWRQKQKTPLRSASPDHTRGALWPIFTLHHRESQTKHRLPRMVDASVPATDLDLHLPSVSPEHSQSTSAIPRIIHQTWVEEKIPSQFSPWVQSWMEYNPSWEYWFWTDEDIRCFMEHHFPQFLALFDSYSFDINRADVMRYFVLYAHGGLYADLDMACARPLDNITLHHSCLLTEENYAHVYVVQRRAPPANVINCLMACRPRHPYFGDVIRELPEQKKRGTDGSVLDQTGPFLIDRVLRRYLNASLSRSPEDTVTVLPPAYFSARFDPMQLSYLKKTCLNPNKLRKEARRACRHLVANKFVNTLAPVSYADHHWQHTYWNMNGFMNQPLDSWPDIARLVACHFNNTPSTPPKTPHSMSHSSNNSCYTPRLKFGSFR